MGACGVENFLFATPLPPHQSTRNWRRRGGVTSGPHITLGAAGTQKGRRCAPWSSGIRPQHPHEPQDTALPVPTPAPTSTRQVSRLPHLENGRRALLLQCAQG